MVAEGPGVARRDDVISGMVGRLSPDCVISGSDPVACRFREAVASARRFSPCDSALLPENVGQASLGRVLPAVGQEKGV